MATRYSLHLEATLKAPASCDSQSWSSLVLQWLGAHGAVSVVAGKARLRYRSLLLPRRYTCLLAPTPLLVAASGLVVGPTRLVPVV